MIKFKRDGKNLCLWFSHNIVPDSIGVFLTEHENSCIAQMYADKFTHTLEKNLSKKIEQAYLEGYKSGENHEKKKTKFLGTFDTQVW